MSLSVIIPVYNAKAFLRQCVQSALEQPEVSEIILVEDGSPDGVLSLCMELAQQHEIVKLFRHPNGENRGAGESRNLGILNSSSEYIAFLDADDYYLQDRFKNDLKILDLNKDIDGVYNILGSKLDGTTQTEQKENTLLTFVKGEVGPEELFEKMEPVGESGYFSIDTLTVRKDIFQKVGLFDVSLPLSQDTHMFVKMAAKARLVSGRVPYPVGIRRIHTNNRSSNSEKLLIYKAQVFKSLFYWSLKEKLEERRSAKLWEKYFAYTFYHGVFKNTPVRRLVFLGESLYVWPRLIMLKSFWQKIPFVRDKI